MTTTLGRLVDRTILVAFAGTVPPGWVRRAAPHLGAIILFGQNIRSYAHCARLASALRGECDPTGRRHDPAARRHGPAGRRDDPAGRRPDPTGRSPDPAGQVLLAVDEEGGDVTRLHYHEGSPVPGNQVLGAADDVSATERIAASIGGELREAGILLDLAPDADVNVDANNPVIGVRSFGSDSDVVARHTAAWVRGLQSTGVAGCAKHFPGHGDTRVDSHRALPTVACTEREWRQVHLPPFAAAIEAGVRSIMTAHLVAPALDEVPATLSRRILRDLLRRDLGFDGVVVTDALDMAAVAATVGVTSAAVGALAAGADLLCLPTAGDERVYRNVRSAIITAVRSGDLPLQRVEEAAARVRQLRAWVATAEARAASGVTAVDDLTLALTRRAAVASRVPPLPGRPAVIELRSSPNLAVGQAAWDLAPPLSELGYPPVLVARVTGPGHDLDAALLRAGGHPVVVVGRDVTRHSWQRAVWRATSAQRPDAVLVDVGLPRPWELRGTAYVMVGGAGRPNLRVAAELLVRGGDDDG